MINNVEKLQLTIPHVRRSCSFCQFFQHEEIGDSDFGGVYAENATCSKYLDTDKETEEEIPNFDRQIERDCCKLDFWRVLEVDNILSEKLTEESDRTGKMDETYELFKERYNMENTKNKQQCAIHDISCSFYDFAKNYIRIKDGANERSLNDKELKQIEEMQQMMDKGYELRLVHLRKGSKIMWCKKNYT